MCLGGVRRRFVVTRWFDLFVGSSYPKDVRGKWEVHVRPMLLRVKEELKR